MRESSSSWSDQELIERMRRDEALAFHELFWRFQTLLVRCARQLRVQPALQEEIVVETLNDAALTLMQYRTPMPRSLAAYLTTALRHRVAAAHRAASAVAEWQPEYDAGPAAGGSFADSSSEGSVRASRGHWAEPPALSPALERLASALDDGLTDEERAILDWVAHWVPQRLIAEWVGMSHGALRIRVWRLRERLREVAVGYAAHLSLPERLELRDFFRRTALLRREGTALGMPPDGDDPAHRVKRAQPRAVGRRDTREERR